VHAAQGSDLMADRRKIALQVVSLFLVGCAITFKRTLFYKLLQLVQELQIEKRTYPTNLESNSSCDVLIDRFDRSAACQRTCRSLLLQSDVWPDHQAVAPPPKLARVRISHQNRVARVAF
jgi:hypothetical protein